MGKLKDMHKKLLALNMEQLCLEATFAVEEQATNMNTDQLWQGEKSDGNNLPDYSPMSVNVFGKPAGPIRLFDQGDFYRGFVFATVDFPISFTSIDEKTSELEERYGSEIFGLNLENQKDLAQNYILPELKKAFLKAVEV